MKRLATVKIQFSLHLIHEFSKIPFKPQLSFWVEIDKTIWKCMWEFQHNQAVLKKNKASGPTSLNFTTHFKATKNKVFGAWLEEKEINETE